MNETTILALLVVNLRLKQKGLNCECYVEYTLSNRARLDAALNCIPQLYVIHERPYRSQNFKAPVLNGNLALFF
jgi:hypothetical protein